MNSRIGLRIFANISNHCASRLTTSRALFVAALPSRAARRRRAVRENSQRRRSAHCSGHGALESSDVSRLFRLDQHRAGNSRRNSHRAAERERDDVAHVSGCDRTGNSCDRLAAAMGWICLTNSAASFTTQRRWEIMHALAVAREEAAPATRKLGLTGRRICRGFAFTLPIKRTARPRKRPSPSGWAKKMCIRVPSDDRIPNGRELVSAR